MVHNSFVGINCEVHCDDVTRKTNTSHRLTMKVQNILLNHALDFILCLCHQFEIIGFSHCMGLVFNNNLVRAFIQWPIINTNRENQLPKFSLQLPKKFFSQPHNCSDL